MKIRWSSVSSPCGSAAAGEVAPSLPGPVLDAGDVHATAVIAQTARTRGTRCTAPESMRLGRARPASPGDGFRRRFDRGGIFVAGHRSLPDEVDEQARA